MYFFFSFFIYYITLYYIFDCLRYARAYLRTGSHAPIFPLVRRLSLGVASKTISRYLDCFCRQDLSRLTNV